MEPRYDLCSIECKVIRPHYRIHKKTIEIQKEIRQWWRKKRDYLSTINGDLRL